VIEFDDPNIQAFCRRQIRKLRAASDYQLSDDDIMQELRIELWLALEASDPERGDGAAMTMFKNRIHWMLMRYNRHYKARLPLTQPPADEEGTALFDSTQQADESYDPTWMKLALEEAPPEVRRFVEAYRTAFGNGHAPSMERLSREVVGVSWRTLAPRVRSWAALSCPVEDRA